MKAPTFSLIVAMIFAVSMETRMDAAEEGSSNPASASRPDNEMQAKARAALYAQEKPAESSAGQPAESPTAEQAAVVPPTSAALASDPLPGSQEDNAAQARARAALAGVYGQMPASTSYPTSAATPQPVVAAPTGPPPPTSAAQQQQLNALLQQYRADAISASQYHARRAEILAGQ